MGQLCIPKCCLKKLQCGVATVLLMAASGSAHVGDTVYPIFEIPTADLPNLHDGTLEDWEQALPLSSMTNEDIGLEQGQHDLSDLAFRVFLRWHNRSQRILFAIELVDDEFIEGDGFVWLMVDGDHSGGTYNYYLEEGMSESERLRLDHAQAQGYVLRPTPQSESSGGFASPSSAAWAALPPWMDVGSHRTGERPATIVIEAEITPWDELSAGGAESSRRTVLEAGRTVGLQIVISDVDPDRVSDQGSLIPRLYSLGDFYTSFSRADGFADAELVPCRVFDCSESPETAVGGDSWGRIKASFR